MSEIGERVIWASMGALQAMHRELGALEESGEIDPALCSIEDAYATLAMQVTPEADPAEVFARYR